MTRLPEVCAGAVADYATRYIGQIVTLEIDRPLGSVHPQYPDLRYDLNYGYVPDTVAPDGEEVDAYVLGVDTPLPTFTGRCVAVICRRDDDDDKLVVVPDGVSVSDEQIRAATRFSERDIASIIVR
ncbi:inorganic pyrophosphatase [Candidatus Poribacteria bacterium]|jgi:inorganic pyrophosphatase|nr:inorganic pyrophosphatase [Candidatus Poribacteria bacterium]MBT5534251.1 inorganic pyrophosphatase [Candidatus Poribacteria bacterium]MBT5712152.1 inorganic pyrophosphatase [Candidatus Poribacteria bacterium]MBT7100148.1 inorganic pyrophosphatase [Candidatus Poribacteria bacterium]MBT7809200.1 inorganic pyrophosphatase [Candidatus Poribacteria bacterium]